ncbi:MAG: hypothetical protein ACFCBV_04385 [Phycisphaerales bacterium]
MKLVGFLLITASLVLGVAAAPTAYLPSLDLPDEELIGLTLNSSAGAQMPDPPPSDPTAAGEPIANQDDELTAELLATLRSAGVERVRVKEFSFARWSGKWLFLLAVAGLIGGAALVRIDMRKRLAASKEAQADAPAAESPAGALAAITEAIEGLRRDLPHMTTDHDREAAIVERLTEAQSVHVPAFVEGRERIIADHGLGGFAELMDRFAAMERLINRAWSAAADGVYEESADCLERASALAEETAKLLNG